MDRTAVGNFVKIKPSGDAMNIVDILVKKRDGKVLTKEEIVWTIESYVSNQIPDYQMSALLMAIYFNGMNCEELTALTHAMVHSGKTIDLSGLSGIKVDKHSTGGVGDKVSLILAPLVASAGVPVPMMAGRGLGHTGGTLDKLEAIPGFRTNLSEKEFRRQLDRIGCVIMGQTEAICPADRKLYALRDVTGTVQSLPLICGSIISKKKAEGADALILDVKFGNGAIFDSKRKMVQLAKALIRLGNKLGIKTVALLTSMEQPLGNTVGNWLETREAVEGLKNRGPEDLMEVVLALGSRMLMLGEKTSSFAEGEKILRKKLTSGEAYDRFIEMVKMQGGDISVIEHPESVPPSKYHSDLISPKSGYIKKINAKEVGLIAITLGAGRFKKEDRLDYTAGLVLHKKVGDRIEKGERLATMYSHKKQAIASATARLHQAFAISEKPPSPPKLIDQSIDQRGKQKSVV
jgi:pyrimidine-nucleoside phosphorylase